MSAIFGLERRRFARFSSARASRGRVALANFNSPTQIVISGELDAVQRAGEAMLAAGAKRVVPLNVSGAWHSELMEPAVERLRAAVEAAHFAMPAFDVISNVDGRPYRDVETIKANLIRSVVDEVRWHDTAERLLAYQPEIVVEFGASGVLSALMKRMPNCAASDGRERFCRRRAAALRDRTAGESERVNFAGKDGADHRREAAESDARSRSSLPGAAPTSR